MYFKLKNINITTKKEFNSFDNKYFYSINVNGKTMIEAIINGIITLEDYKIICDYLTNAYKGKLKYSTDIVVFESQQEGNLFIEKCLDDCYICRRINK